MATQPPYIDPRRFKNPDPARNMTPVFQTPAPQTSGVLINKSTLGSAVDGMDPRQTLDYMRSKYGDWAKADVPAKSGLNIPWQKVFSGISKMTPYISNIANSMRRAPRPLYPKLNSPVAAQRVNFDDQRIEADRSIRGANLNADKTLDSNTAAAVKTANLVQGIRAKNSIAAQEANMNAGLAAQAAQLNANIESQNTGYVNQWTRDLTEAGIADNRNQSANLSNAADKYIMGQNEQAKADLELGKLGVYSRLWKDSGVYDRLLADLKKDGMKDPTGMTKLAGGGDLSPTEATVTKRPELYTPWGNQATSAMDEGWMPTSVSDRETVYQNRYNAPFNSVEIPGSQQKGHLAVIGRSNNQFDIAIRDSNNNPVHYINKGISPEEVQAYIKSNYGTIAQRTETLRKNSASQGYVKFKAGGSLTKVFK